MKKKHIALLRYLCDHAEPVTSKELAGALDISIRSVKNYVNEINLIATDKIIYSSNNGYRADKEQAMQFIDNKNPVPQTSEERGLYIIKQLLFEHTSHLDLYELCDALYISYSTLKSDIAKMNKSLSNFDVQFTCKNDTVKLTGEEKNLRRLVSHVIYEETNNQFMDPVLLEESFRNIEVDKIASIIKYTFHKYNYYINDFSFINMQLHLAIMIDRIRDGNYVHSLDKFYIENKREYNLVSELYHSLEKEYDITLTETERFEIYMLFKTNANYSSELSKDMIKSVVGESIIELTTYLIEKVNNVYFIDLFTENFMTPFALHLKNLLLRAKNGTFTKNPMASMIKTSYPTVYDIAIFISVELMQTYHIHINEDEVAFLALHIGAEIEREKSNEYKIKCVLYCPDYIQIMNQLYNQLLIDFGNEIDIIKTVTNERDLPKRYYDLLISTIKVQTAVPQMTMLIPPFVHQLDKSEIYTTLERIRRNKKNYILKKHFDNFFSSKLFALDPPRLEKESVIRLLSGKMMAAEYVGDTFAEHVFIRENAASTAFGSIAIPHSMEMDADKTSIAVAISKSGIDWKPGQVNIVLLVAMNKRDKKIFHELYEAIIELFSDEGLIEAMKTCCNFDDFKKNIYNNINFDLD